MKNLRHSVSLALIGSLMLAAMPLATRADDHRLSYSYVEGGYSGLDPENTVSGNGFAVRGSIGIADSVFLFAEHATFDFSGGVDVDRSSIGIGGRLGVSDKLDLVGRVGYTEADLSASSLGSADADGYLVSAGVRGEVADDFELEGHVIYTDLGDTGGENTALAFGGRYFLTENLEIGAEYQVGDDAREIFAGLRYSF